MRTLKNLLLLVLITLGFSLNAQTKDESYRVLRQRGVDYYNHQKFNDAITAFRLARIADDKPRDNDIDQWIEKAFEKLVVLLEIEKDRAFQAEQEARQEAKASELAGLAYKLAKTKPTEAVRVAEFATELNANSKSAKQQFHDLISLTPPPFYAQSIPFNDKISAVAVSPDGLQILIGCWNNHLYLRHAFGDGIIDIPAHEEPIVAVAFSPDGQHFLSGSSDNTAKLWDLNGKLVQSFIGHISDISAIAISTDGKHVATGSWDNTIRIWTLDGKCLKTIDANQGLITSLSFSKNSPILWSAGLENSPIGWSMNGDSLMTLSGHKGAVSAIGQSQNGEMMITAGWDGKIIVWNNEGQQLHEIEASNRPIAKVRFTADDQNIIFTDDNYEAKLIKFSGEVIQTYSEHSNLVNGLAISPDGSYFITGSYDQSVKVFSLWGPLIRQIEMDSFGLKSLAFVEQLDAFLICRKNNTPVLVDQKGHILLELKGHTDVVNKVAVSPNGQFFATASSDFTAKLWDQNGNQLVTFKNHNSIVQSVVFSPDGQYILSAGNDDGARLWKITGEEVQVFSGHKENVIAATFSPDGKMILTSSLDKTNKLWNIQGEELHSFEEHKNRSYHATFSPDGQMIATTNEDHTAKLWTLEGQLLATFSGHNKPIIKAEFTPDGKQLLTSDYTGKIKVWDLQGNEIQTLNGHQAAVWDFIFLDDGNTLVSVSHDKTMRFWHTVKSYINSNRIGKLEMEKQVAYGLIEKLPDAFTQEEKKTKPPIHREEYVLTYFKDRDARGWGEKERNSFRLATLLSSKAGLAPDLEEKLFLQQQSIHFSKNFTINFLVPYYHGNMAIWKLADAKNAEAQSFIDSALVLVENANAFANYTQLKAVLQGKQAIIFACNEKIVEATRIIQECKNQDLTEHNFNNIYGLVTGNDLEEMTKVGDLLLEDINYLISNNLDHSNLTKLKDLLVQKP